MRFSMSDVRAPIPRHKAARLFRALREEGMRERSPSPDRRTFSGEMEGAEVEIRFRRRGHLWYLESMKGSADGAPDYVRLRGV